MGALVVSAGNALLLASPLFGRLAARIGLRRPIIAAFIGNGLLTILAAVFFEMPAAVVATLLAAAVGAAVLDALGNIPFMRSVRPFERPQMTTVFRTYIDLSDLLPAAVFSFLLSYFDMRAVFVASGLFCLVVAVVARRLPQRM
jgi:MFS family permease